METHIITGCELPIIELKLTVAHKDLIKEISDLKNLIIKKDRHLIINHQIIPPRVNEAFQYVQN